MWGAIMPPLFPSGNSAERPKRPGVRHGIPPLAVLIFLVGLVFLFNFPLWRMLRVMERSMQAMLAERLRWSAQLVLNELKVGDRPPAILEMTQGLERDTEVEILEAFVDTTTYRSMLDRLIALQGMNGLAQAALITSSGIVVADSTGKSRPGENSRFIDIDRRQIAEARLGKASATALYRLDGTPYKRLYLPVVQDNSVIGIVQVAISPDYLSELDALRRRVWVQSLVGSAILLLVGASIWSLFNYLVKLEQKAMQGARVEAMGALAGGVAHELRNPLSIIRVLAEEAAAESPPGSRAAENARDIVGEVERLGDMVTHFLSLSRPPEEGGARPVDIGAEIPRVTQLLGRGEGVRIRFAVDVPDEPLFVRGDERALRQVFLNLLLNAREAVGDDGEVRVTLRARRGEAEVHVIDNGRGIEPRDAARVFEPFFTTKPAGTGLGLAITKGIAENLGGSVSIESKPGRGTDVCVILPRCDPPEV